MKIDKDKVGPRSGDCQLFPASYAESILNKSILTITFQVLVSLQCGNLVGQNLEVLQKARLVPSHLDSCNLEYASEVSLFYPRKLAVDGDKFYLNAGPKTVAFDGKQYWSKNANGKDALISKMKVSASIQLDIHPLILPYSWFWENISQGKWTDLRSQEIWDATIKRMTFRESKPILGQDCCIYEIAYSSDNVFLCCPRQGWFSNSSGIQKRR